MFLQKAQLNSLLRSISKGSTIDGIKLEYGHPQLAKRRFDLFFKNHLGENNAYEFKYIKNGSTTFPYEKQRIFDDLMRLYLFLEKDGDGKGYFLICGNQEGFIKDFQKLLVKSAGDLPITPKVRHPSKGKIQTGFYTEWFSFDTCKPNKVIDIARGRQEYQDIYKGFLNEYSDAYLKKSKVSLSLPDFLPLHCYFYRVTRMVLHNSTNLLKLVSGK